MEQRLVGGVNGAACVNQLLVGGVNGAACFNQLLSVTVRPVSRQAAYHTQPAACVVSLLNISFYPQYNLHMVAGQTDRVQLIALLC